MVAWAKQSVSSTVFESSGNLLLDGCTVGLDRSFPLRDITSSMRLAEGERVVVQNEVGIPGARRDGNEVDTCEDSDGNGTDGGRFPNVRKKYWRAAAWQSLSAPSSPSPAPLQPSGFGENRKTVTLTPRLQQQSVKVRPPPLQQPRRSADGIVGGYDEGNQWQPATPGGRRDIRGIIGPEMKLDLGAVQRNRDTCEPTEMQMKRDKFAFFDKECSRIVEHVYLGSDAVARNRDTLRENGITHVLNCVGFVCPEYFPENLSYKTLWLQDSPSEDITSILYDVFDYFEEVREVGGRVFVHCCQGVSRSTSLVIAYLMWRDGRSFEDAFQDVKAARGVTNPNLGFACQLLQCQKRVHAAPVSPNSVLRMYRMAPHSLYDPLHLVPKTVNHPSAGALDSRGAFVVHVPSALFVWQGSMCGSCMVNAAHAFTYQVIRYERAKGPVIRISEGDEPCEFWEALKKGGSHGNKNQDLGAGKENGSPKLRGVVAEVGVGDAILKKVPAYDVDFETYQRAKEGGVMPRVPLSGLATHVPRDSGWSCLRRKFFSGSGSKSLQFREGQVSAISATKAPRTPAESKAQNPEEGWLSTMVVSGPVASPDPSQCSSASPFSFRSFSSSSSRSPPFLTSPCMSPPPSPSPSLSHTPSPNYSIVWSPTASQTSSPAPTSIHAPYLSLDHLPSQVDNKYLSQSPSRGSTQSLAQRRGSVSPSLRLPTLVDEPPPTPRRKPVLPPILTENVKGRESLALENGEKRYSRDVPETSRDGSSGSSFGSTSSERGNQIEQSVQQHKDVTWANSSSRFQSSQVEDRAEPSNAGRGYPKGDGSSESCAPSLFEWPLMEKIDMFDADDLDPGAAFVLLVPDSSHGRGGRLYLWVGTCLRSEGELHSSGDEGDFETRNEEEWQKIGMNLAKQLQLPEDMPVKVIFKLLSFPS